MNLPLFTILIPTRNRPDLVAAAIASACGQGGEDVEIIVSDNSTDAAAVEAVRIAVERARDPRVRLIRPPEPLEMPAHWEWATRQAAGDYLLILTDRFVIRPGVLEMLRTLVAAQKPDILRWTTESGLLADGQFFERAYSGAVETKDCRDVLVDFAGCGQWRAALIGSNRLPRGLNSAVRRDLIERIREAHGAAYAPLSPDYTSAIHQLVAADTIVEIDAPLYAVHGSVGNGASSMRDGVATYLPDFEGDRFEGCPLRIDTVINTTIRDYLWVGRTTGADLPPIDMVGYLLLNWRELQLKTEMGSKLDVSAMRKAILKAADGLDRQARARFDAGRAQIDARDTPVFRLRNRLARLGLLDAVKAAVPKRRRFASILDAVDANPVRIAGA